MMRRAATVFAGASLPLLTRLGPELAHELERRGYDWLLEQAAA